MVDPGTPLQTLEHGKRLLDELLEHARKTLDLALELEPSLRIRSAIADQLGEHCRARAVELKEQAMLKPSGLIPAVKHPSDER